MPSVKLIKDEKRVPLSDSTLEVSKRFVVIIP